MPRKLETIVLKAMRKEPEERYATARELSDDLRRYLADEPIRAKRPTLVDRTFKWSRRHRGLVATALVLLLMATISLSVSNLLIARQRARAELERERADDNFQIASIRWTITSPRSAKASGCSSPACCRCERNYSSRHWVFTSSSFSNGTMIPRWNTSWPEPMCASAPSTICWGPLPNRSRHTAKRWRYPLDCSHRIPGTRLSVTWRRKATLHWDCSTIKARIMPKPLTLTGVCWRYCAIQGWRDLPCRLRRSSSAVV